MKVKNVPSLTSVIGEMLSEIKAGARHDDDGRPISEYHTLLESSDGQTKLSASVMEDWQDEWDAHGESLDRWYEVHVIDDINDRNCMLKMTETLSDDELLVELLRIITQTACLAANLPESGVS